MPHIHEKIDFCSEVYVVYNNKVLLRIHDKLKIWLSVGGHVELDEDPNEAAVREVKEEVGLDVELIADRPHGIIDGEKELIVPRALVRHHISATHEHVVFVFYAKARSAVITEGETEKSQSCRWFTKEELHDPKFGIKPQIARFAQQAIDEVSKVK
jgi:8-oxo-dGTP pyrophosphatase MutT (NUDIX family)